MSRFIAIANQKGGVGKTTTTVNLAASLARFGQRVLVLDMDPQGNTSSGLGVQANALHRGIYEVLMGSMAVDEAITSQASPGVDLLPSGQRLIGAEVELVSALARERILEKGIQPVRDNYDVILADCPPSLGLLTVNTLTAADTVLIPMQCEYYALEGLTQLINTIKLIQQALNPRLEIEGILLTMFDARLNLSHEVAEETRKFFPGRVYETVIPRNVRLSEAPSFGKPVLEYDPECAGAQFYLKLAREVLKLPEDATPVVTQVEEPEVEAAAEHRTEDADLVPASTAAITEESVASPDSGFDRAHQSVEVDARHHDHASSIALDRDALEVEAIAAQLSEATPAETDLPPVALDEEPVAFEEQPVVSEEQPAVFEEQPLVLSPDDLAEDVPTLSEESIVPAEEAVTLASESQWGADSIPTDDSSIASDNSQPVELVVSPEPIASDNSEPPESNPTNNADSPESNPTNNADSPENNPANNGEPVSTPETTFSEDPNSNAEPPSLDEPAVQYTDLQPMTEQDAHHPQEELVSHD